jgi:hypothetical protein
VGIHVGHDVHEVHAFVTRQHRHRVVVDARARMNSRGECLRLGLAWSQTATHVTSPSSLPSRKLVTRPEARPRRWRKALMNGARHGSVQLQQDDADRRYFHTDGAVHRANVFPPPGTLRGLTSGREWRPRDVLEHHRLRFVANPASNTRRAPVGIRQRSQRIGPQRMAAAESDCADASASSAGRAANT